MFDEPPTGMNLKVCYKHPKKDIYTDNTIFYGIPILKLSE